MWLQDPGSNVSTARASSRTPWAPIPSTIGDMIGSIAFFRALMRHIQVPPIVIFDDEDRSGTHVGVLNNHLIPLVLRNISLRG